MAEVIGLFDKKKEAHMPRLPKQKPVGETFGSQLTKQIVEVAEIAAQSYVKGLLAQKKMDNTVFEQLNRKISDVQQVLDVLLTVKSQLEQQGENAGLEREALEKLVSYLDKI